MNLSITNIILFLVQAEDRVYRIGQQNAVNIQYLCARGTADDELWKMIGDKLEILGKVGLTKESMTDTRQSVMDSREEDIEKLKAFKDQNPEKEEFKKQKNKITGYVEKTKPETKMQKTKTTEPKVKEVKEKKKSSLEKSKSTKDVSGVEKMLEGLDYSDFLTQQPQAKAQVNPVDKMLEGLDYSDFLTQKQEPQVQAVETAKKTTPPRKISDMLEDDDEDALLAGVNLKAFEETPPKKQRSIFKKK